MKTLTEQLEEILLPRISTSLSDVLPKLLQAVKERDAYVIGEDHTTPCDWEIIFGRCFANEVHADQRKRAEETL